LAKDTVEALGVITERECPECSSCGLYRLNKHGKMVDELECFTCSGTGKIGWKWEPKPGEWCVLWDKAVLIYRTYDDKVIVNLGQPEHRAKNVIPILHWEEIERVLEGVGYYLKLNHYDQENGSAFVARFDREKTNEFLPEHEVPCKSRQEVVMRAVIKLGEELNEDK